MNERIQGPTGTAPGDSIDEMELELRRLPGVRFAGFQDEDDVLLVQLDLTTPAEGSAAAGPIEAVRIAARHVQRAVAVEVNRHVAASSSIDLAAVESAEAGRAAMPQPDPAPQEAPVETDETETASQSTESAEQPDQPATDEEQPQSPTEAGEEPETAADAARARLLSVLAFPDTDEVEVHLVLGNRRTIGRALASAGIEGVADATIAAVREFEPGFAIELSQARRIELEGDPLIAVSLTIGRLGEKRKPLHGIASSSGPMDATARATLSALNRHLTAATAR